MLARGLNISFSDFMRLQHDMTLHYREMYLIAMSYVSERSMGGESSIPEIWSRDAIFCMMKRCLEAYEKFEEKEGFFEGFSKTQKWDSRWQPLLKGVPETSQSSIFDGVELENPRKRSHSDMSEVGLSDGSCKRRKVIDAKVRLPEVTVMANASVVSGSGRSIEGQTMKRGFQDCSRSEVAEANDSGRTVKRPKLADLKPATQSNKRAFEQTSDGADGASDSSGPPAKWRRVEHLVEQEQSEKTPLERHRRKDAEEASEAVFPPSKRVCLPLRAANELLS